MFEGESNPLLGRSRGLASKILKTIGMAVAFGCCVNCKDMTESVSRRH